MGQALKVGAAMFFINLPGHYQEACLLPGKLVSSGARFWFDSTDSKTKQAPPRTADA
jgi:hypothetical protein